MNVRKAIRVTALAGLLALPLAAVAADEARARIVTGGEKPTECIAAVHVNRIDDREVKVQGNGFDIEPGRHTLSARASINTSLCAAVGIGTGRYGAEPLEAEFEAGKTYYVGYDHSSPHRRDWKLVIWKVVDSPRG